MKHAIVDDGENVLVVPPANESGAAPPNPDELAMQKKMEAARTPGPAHKALDAFIGDWNAEVKSWCKPDGPPDVSQGTSKVAWILDGHYVQADFHGEMIGKAFTGQTLMGYDNIQERFNSVWISDMQTSMLVNSGKGENGNKVITLEGTSGCAGTGRNDIPIKTIYRVINPDRYVFEMFNDGVKSMEITYTRK